MMPEEKPICATGHCRHYSFNFDDFFKDIGPVCAKGVDLATATLGRDPAMPAHESLWKCMPRDLRPAPSDLEPSAVELELSAIEPCPLREEFTAEERAAYEAWSDKRSEEANRNMKQIPPGKAGDYGTVTCLTCAGTISWGRASSNGHLHASCSTPGCFGVMQ